MRAFDRQAHETAVDMKRALAVRAERRLVHICPRELPRPKKFQRHREANNQGSWGERALQHRPNRAFWRHYWGVDVGAAASLPQNITQFDAELAFLGVDKESLAGGLSNLAESSITWVCPRERGGPASRKIIFLTRLTALLSSVECLVPGGGQAGFGRSFTGDSSLTI